MISAPELSRLAALIAECAQPHCGNGPRNSLTTALHQCAPAFILELQHLKADRDELIKLLKKLTDIEGPQPGTSEWGSEVTALLRQLGEA